MHCRLAFVSNARREHVCDISSPICFPLVLSTRLSFGRACLLCVASGRNMRESENTPKFGVLSDSRGCVPNRAGLAYSNNPPARPKKNCLPWNKMQTRISLPIARCVVPNGCRQNTAKDSMAALSRLSSVPLTSKSCELAHAALTDHCVLTRVLRDDAGVLCGDARASASAARGRTESLTMWRSPWGS